MAFLQHLIRWLQIMLASFSWCLSKGVRHQHPFLWDEMNEIHNMTRGVNHRGDGNSIPFASTILQGQHLYVSLTTIHNRIYGIMTTIESIISGTVWPDHIYVFVSRDPYLLDLGVTPGFILSESKGKLTEILQIYPWISVVFTENLGPHRKLLPLLAKKWDEDCVIVTIDDHETYRKKTLETLMKFYDESGRNAVVALRARRMGICSDAPPWRVAPYTKNRKGLWPEASPAYREMLILPTGTGGVLYRPRFFHPIVFDRRLINSTKTGDDLLFRLATLAMSVPVVTACVERDALGKPCPAGIIRIDRYNRDYPSMAQFTFGSNYSDESEQGLFRSPGVQSAYKVVQHNNEHAKKHRGRRKRGSSPKEITLSLFNSSNGAMRQLSVEAQPNQLRSVAEPVVKWENDPRRIESLASKFNTGGGNNAMWRQTLDLLEETKIFDFHAFLQHFAPFERKQCLLSYSVLSKAKEIDQKTSFFDQLKISIQSVYSAQCGLNACDYEHRKKKLYTATNHVLENSSTIS